MESKQIERRTVSPTVGGQAASPEAARIVHRGILIRASIGTLSAVEYLKLHDIGSDVIGRVLSDGHVRHEDRLALVATT